MSEELERLPAQRIAAFQRRLRAISDELYNINRHNEEDPRMIPYGNAASLKEVMEIYLRDWDAFLREYLTEEEIQRLTSQ